MRTSVRLAVVAAAVGVVAGASATVSWAAVPPGYVVASSGDLNAPAGQQTADGATCPTGTVVYGGGEYSTATTLGASLGSTFYDGDGEFDTWLNNSDPTDTTTNAYAVCADAVAGMTVVAIHAENVAHSRLHVAPTCPTGDEVLGGATISNDTGLGERMVSSYPVKVGTGTSATYSWATDMSNTYKSTNTDMTFMAMCAPIGSIRGYQIVHGPAVTLDPLTQGNAQIACPTVKAPLSGGVRTSTKSLKLSINSTYPFGGSWGSFVNNPTTNVEPKLTPYAVCAGH